MASSGKYAGMYIGDPDIDFVKLAGSQNVAGERVTAGNDLRAALERGITLRKKGVHISSKWLSRAMVAERIPPGTNRSTWHRTGRRKFELAKARVF